MEIRLSVDPRDSKALERAFYLAGGKVRRDLAAAYQSVATVIAKQARAAAPRGERTSAASTLYGPLSEKIRSKRAKAALGIVMVAPYYKNFVEAGKAGDNIITPRPFIQNTIERTRRRWEGVLESKLMRLLAKHGLETE